MQCVSRYTCRRIRDFETFANTFTNMSMNTPMSRFVHEDIREHQHEHVHLHVHIREHVHRHSHEQEHDHVINMDMNTFKDTSLVHHVVCITSFWLCIAPAIMASGVFWISWTQLEFGTRISPWDGQCCSEPRISWARALSRLATTVFARTKNYLVV